MAYRKLGVQFVHRGLSSFKRAFDVANRSIQQFGRSKIENARKDVYAARSAERLANTLKNKLGREVDALGRSMKRYSDISLNLRLGMTQQQRLWITQIEQGRNYQSVLAGLVTREQHRRGILDQLTNSQKLNNRQLQIAGTQLKTAETAIAGYIDRNAKLLTSNIKNTKEQQKMEAAVRKLLQAFAEQLINMEDLEDAVNEYGIAMQDASKKSQELSTAERIWQGLTDKFMKFGQAASAVSTAVGAAIPVVNAIGGVFRTVTRIVGKAVGTVLDAAMAIGRTLFDAVKKLLSIPINMVKGFFNAFTNSLQRIFEIVVGMNLSRIIWGLGRAIVQAGKDAYNAAVDFQFLEVRLTGLLSREYRDAGYNLAESTGMARDELEGLTDWISKLAVMSPISAEEIANTFTLAMSYNFTKKEAMGLTESILTFSTAMGLSNLEMTRIIENFGQMRQQGKVTGTELRDLARGAFVPVTDVLREMGVEVGLLSGVEIPSLSKITTDLGEMLLSGKLTEEEFEKLNEGLKENAVGSSISAQGLKNLYTNGLLTKDVMADLGFSVEDLDTAMSDLAFDEMRDELNALIKDGTVSVDEFFWAFEKIVAEDFPDVMENASNTMKTARQNARDFLETVLGWRVITPSLDVIADKISGVLDALMGEKSLDLFKALGQGFKTITQAIFDFTDVLINLSAYKNTIGLITDVLTNLFSIIGAMGRDDGVWNANQAIIELRNSLILLGIEDISSVMDGLELLNETLTGMGDTDPRETWGKFWESIGMIFGPLWEEIIKPALGTLMGNIKDFVVTEWETNIKPSLNNFLEEVVLPGLETFITETIPSWASTIAEQVPIIAGNLTDKLLVALEDLESWAEENTGKDSLLSNTVTLIKELANYLSTSFTGGEEYVPFSMGNPMQKQTTDNIVTALDSLAESMQVLVGTSPLFDKFVVQPLKSLAETKVGNWIDSVIRLFETIGDVLGKPFDLLGNLVELLKTIFNVGNKGGGKLDWLLDISTFFNNTLTFISDAATFPLDMMIAVIENVTTLIQKIREFGVYGLGENWTAEDTSNMFEPITNLFDSLKTIFDSDSEGVLDSLSQFLSNFQTDSEDLRKELEIFELDLSSIGNGEDITAPFTDIAEETEKNINKLSGEYDEGFSPVESMKGMLSEIEKIGNKGSYEKAPFIDMADESEKRWKDLDISLIQQSIIPEMLEKIVTYLSENTPRITEEFTKTVNNIKVEVEGLDLNPAGQQIVQGLIDGMKLKFAELMAWWQFTALQQLKEITETTLDMTSPSKVFEKYGLMVMQGFLNGLGSGFNTVAQVFTSRMSDLRAVAGHVSTVNNSSVNNINNTSLDNRNIVINMQQAPSNLSLSYDYVRAITA